MSDILEICIDGANKTKIVYNANLNFKILNSYLDALTKKGLLNIRKNHGNEYVTTEEGIRMLETCRSIDLELGQ